MAVFGDTHGHLRLMFQLCRLWQLNHGRHLDLILQCGDLGYFPDPENLDKATRRYARKDPEELGFRYFTKPKPLVEDAKLTRILTGPDGDLGTVRCPVYFCHGNHEDFQSLEREVGEGSVATVDFYDRLHWVRPGHIEECDGFRIAAVGGKSEWPDTPDDDCGLEEPWEWVNNRACEELCFESFDILLTHTSPAGIGGASDQFGSGRLRLVTELAQPAFHFYAHHTQPISPASSCPETGVLTNCEA